MIRRSVRRWIPELTIAALAIALSTDLSAAFKYLSEGMSAPEFSGEDLRTGQELESSEFLGEPGRILLVAFWATWSERSLDLLSDLTEFARDDRYSRMDIVAVNVEGARIDDQRWSRIRAAVDELDPPFPVIVDEGLDIFYAYGVVSVPSTAILDDRGVLLYAPAGYSYSIRDRIVDSVETRLGYREESQFEAPPLYVPTPEASRQYNLARQLVQLGLPERSLEHLDEAASLDSKFGAVEVLRGEALLALDKPAEALEAYRKATELSAESVSAWAGLGRAQVVLGNDASAVSALERAIGLDSAYTPALVSLARVHLGTGDLESASSLLAEARELSPSDPELNFLLGEVRHRQGHLRDALGAYAVALEQLFPFDWDPRGDR